LDVTRGQSQVATARAQLIVARNDRDRAQLDLRRALNLSLDTPLELTDSLSSQPQRDVMSEQASVDVALRTRPDLRAAQAQLEAALARQSLAEQEVQQARERFRAGVAGNADVISALQSLNNARTGMIDALTAYQAARVSLARAEGTVSQLR